MIASLGTLVRRAAAQLADDHDVQANLDEVADAVDQAPTPSEAVKLATALLRQRSLALQNATRKVEQLRVTLAHLGEVLPFIDEGWPERKQELETLLADNAEEGLAAWLGDWFKAATYRRTEALGRLVQVDNLPPAARLLVERCETAARGLEVPSWYTAQALLTAGAKGARIGGQTVPAPDVQLNAWLLVARLALADLASEISPPRRELLAEAAAGALRGAEEHDASPAVGALWARWHRLRGESEPAAQKLASAGVDAPTDLDVAVELIEKARDDKRWELALDTARNAIDALPTLADIDAELRRLVSHPAELEAAVAERAFDEGETALCVAAADRAEALALVSDYLLRATAAEARARAADARGDPPAERASAYAAAGNQRLWAGQLEVAVQHFDAALELDRDNVDAACGAADCRVALASSQPLAQSKPDLDRALELILGVEERGAVSVDNSWSLLVEAKAREQLAGLASPDAETQRWLALRAVCRSIAYQPDAAARWVDLVAAAESLELNSVADAASARAVELGPDDPAATSSRVQSLTNGGRLAEALELLGDSADPWSQAVRAYIQVRLGNPEEAFRVLRSTELSPTWEWAYQTLIAALLFTGRYDDARREAGLAQERSEERLSEVDGALSAAFAELVIGNYERAVELAAPFAEREAEAAWTVGNARILSADYERGLDALVHSIRLTRSQRELDDWERWSKPFLLDLAARRGLTPPSLERVETAVAERGMQLAALADPVTELVDAEAGDADPDVVELAKALGAAVLHLGRDDPAAAVAALDGIVPPSTDEAIAALRRHATARTLARAVVAGVRNGAADPAPLLQELLAVAPAESGSLLRAETSADSTLVERVRGELRALAGSGECAAEATSALALLDDQEADPESDATPERPLEAVMPPSWFANDSDPVNTHPLFLRYIPELRARATWDVPAINVRTDEELEPDRYRILVRDELAEDGSSDVGYVYAERDAVDLLGRAIGSAAQPDDGTGLMRIPRHSLAGSDGFAEIMTMSAEEVVVRHIGAIARDHAD